GTSVARSPRSHGRAPPRHRRFASPPKLSRERTRSSIARLTRACRVRPDLRAVDRVFDYLVPEELAGLVSVGTIVRVPLHGRRVRGWVVETDVEPPLDPDRVLPLHAVVSAGPPPDVVALCEWAAWRWAGPSAALLRVASPPNVVAPDS